MKDKTGKEVATVAASELVDYESLGVTAGAGFENMGRDEYIVPFIRLLQPTSPSVVDQVAGALGGHWVNTATGEFYPSIEFVPAAREEKWVEWVPRLADGSLPPDVGSGLVGQYGPNDEVVLNAKATGEFGAYKTPAGNDLVQTFYLYGTAITPEGDRFPAIIAFASTHSKSYAQLITMVSTQKYVDGKGQRQTYPIFSHVVKFTSAKKEKGKNKWFVPVPAWAKGTAAASRLSVTDTDFLDSVEVYKSFMAGKVKADLSQAANDTAPRGAGGGADDKDIPF